MTSQTDIASAPQAEYSWNEQCGASCTGGEVVNLSPTFPPYQVFDFSPRSLTKLLGLSGFRLIKLRTYATPAVIETQESPVPPLMRGLVKGALFLSAKLGSGTYVDAWAVKNGNGRQ
jgi:hypothetical protein